MGTGARRRRFGLALAGVAVPATAVPAATALTPGAAGFAAASTTSAAKAHPDQTSAFADALATTEDFDGIQDAPLDDFVATFTPAGGFDLLVQRLGRHDIRFRGRYAIGSNGRLDLSLGTGSTRRHVVGTVAVHSNPQGARFPGRGLVLNLDGVTPDVHGNFGGSGYPPDLLDDQPSAAAPWTPGRFGADTCTRPATD